MLRRDDWLDLARKLDWTYSYVDEADVFPRVVSGSPHLSHDAWKEWDEPFRNSYREYVVGQAAKEASVQAVRDAVGRPEDFRRLDPSWLASLKFHSATFALAEFSAVIGNLRAARFGRDSAWRSAAAFGALDELRHTQIPLSIMHELVRFDPQFDWTHRLLHSNHWIAIAARHLLDELLLTSDPIEFAVATNFVFETGFTNLQFIGFSAMAHATGDRMFEKMLSSIQTDEARHAQIGPAVLAVLVKHDKGRAQALVDKWFWRNALFFAVVTGFSMDYLTPVRDRVQSYREFMEEWVLEQFDQSLRDAGLERPWYWELFLDSIELYHHMVYVSAYTYRATLWFDLPMPGPEELAWLATKYPRTWPHVAPIWERIAERWKEGGGEVEWYVHGTTPIAFCNLCQLVLCGGTPFENTACTLERGGERFIFCSEPCRAIFAGDPERYAAHRGLVQRILEGEAPANLLQLVHQYFGISEAVSGKDSARRSPRRDVATSPAPQNARGPERPSAAGPSASQSPST